METQRFNRLRRQEWSPRKSSLLAAENRRRAAGYQGWIRYLAIGWSLCTAVPAHGQVVSGRVIDEDTKAPLAGAFVTVIDTIGKTVRGVLTNSAGSFHLPTSAEVFSLRVDLIGYLSYNSPRLSRPVNDIVLPMKSRPMSLDPVVAQASRSCRSHESLDSTTTATFLDVMKSLELMRWTTEQAVIAYSVEDYFQRRLTWYKVTQEPHKTRSVIVGSSTPFASPPIDTLLRYSFIRALPRNEFDFYAPDVETLLAPQFHETHCFRLVDNEDDPELLGLEFQSKKVIRPSDVFGVLWVDRMSHELRYLDFQYTKLPRNTPTDGTCGRLDFQRLESGMSFVSEWWIRAPLDIPSDAVLHEQSGRQVVDASMDGRMVYRWKGNRHWWGTEVPGQGDPFVCARIP